MTQDLNKLSEEDTKRLYITKALYNKGWQDNQIIMEYPIKVTRYKIVSSEFKVEEIEQTSTNKADYVLSYIQNCPIAIIEAKAYKYQDSEGIDQAKKYAQALNVPFAYASSGHKFIEYNFKTGEQKEIVLEDFPTPNELFDRFCALQNIDESKKNTLVKAKYYTSTDGLIPRYYQLNAINKVVNSIILENRKRALLVMATGTGKTFTAFQIIWRLVEAKVIQNVLYLADRNQLVDQTITGDFKPFAKNMTKIAKGKINTNYSIYFGLYQQLAKSNSEIVNSKTEEVFNYTQVSKDYFDLIVVDECHRGSAKEDSAWRDILTYFDSSIQIGLTATPNTKDDANNINYFGEPLYTYSLKQGIEDGYLAPYVVISHILNKDEDGWRPRDGEVDETGRLIDDKVYTLADFDRTVELQDRIDLVAKTVNDYLHRIGEMSKTIIFCASQRHALKMRDALRKLNPKKMKENSNYIVRMTSDDEEGKSLYDDFTSINKDYPVVVTTSKLLTTGADTKCVKLIVLDAPIKSMTEFKQIIGRGTRLVKEKGKVFFTILDFRRVSKLFYDPDFDGDITIIDEPIPDVHTLPDIIDKPIIKKPKNGDKDGDDEKIKTPIFEVKKSDIALIAKEVSYLDLNNKLIPEKFIDYTRKNILEMYKTEQDFIEIWNNAEQKQQIIEILSEKGIDVDDLESALDTRDMDVFDMICHIAYGNPKVTRKTRATQVKESNFLDKYKDIAKEVLNILLDRYMLDGISNIENVSVLQLDDFNDYGGIVNIMQSFGGKQAYLDAIKDLENHIYTPISEQSSSINA